MMGNNDRFSDYNYFLAALQQHTKKEGHGIFEYIGKNCDLTGAHIGQVANGKKRASPPVRRVIGNFIYGSYERMLETGRALIEGREPPEHPPHPHEGHTENHPTNTITLPENRGDITIRIPFGPGTSAAAVDTLVCSDFITISIKRG